MSNKLADWSVLKASLPSNPKISTVFNSLSLFKKMQPWKINKFTLHWSFQLLTQLSGFSLLLLTIKLSSNRLIVNMPSNLIPPKSTSWIFTYITSKMRRSKSCSPCRLIDLGTRTTSIKFGSIEKQIISIWTPLQRSFAGQKVCKPARFLYG